MAQIYSFYATNMHAVFCHPSDIKTAEVLLQSRRGSSARIVEFRVENMLCSRVKMPDRGHHLAIAAMFSVRAIIAVGQEAILAQSVLFRYVPNTCTHNFF